MMVTVLIVKYLIQCLIHSGYGFGGHCWKRHWEDSTDSSLRTQGEAQNKTKDTEYVKIWEIT